LVSTGYGRYLAAERELADAVISEIKAYGLGAYHLYPDVGTVLDIGGQDSKVIRVGPEGKVLRFEMNDRCAAGTGRFLENMALALEMPVEEIGPHAWVAEGHQPPRGLGVAPGHRGPRQRHDPARRRPRAIRVCRRRGP